MLSLINLSKEKKAKVIELRGGCAFQKKLRTMGIREGKIIKIIISQPFYGPIVVEVERNQVTIGRKMAERIFVEAI